MGNSKEKIILTQEEQMVAEKFHNIIDRNMSRFHKWWIPTHVGMNTDVDEEVDKKVLEHAQNISANAAQSIGYYGLTIFHQLVCHNYYEAVEILLKKGVNPNVRAGEGKGDYADSHKGITPLHLACHGGNEKMVKLLLEYGADTTVCDDKGRNCFHFLASDYYRYVCRYSERSEREAAEQRLEIAKWLKCDCEINQRDVDGVTPLHRLVQNDSKNYARLLFAEYLEYGADVTIADNEGNTVLMTAVENMHITITEMILQYPELVNRQNQVGDTALHKAFFGNKWNKAAAYLLVEAGAEIDVTNDAGENVAEYVKEQVTESSWKLEEKCMFQKPLTIKDYFSIMEDFARDWWGGKYDDYSSFVHLITRKILRKIDRDDDTELVYAIKLMEKLLWGRNESADALQIFYEEGIDLCMPICERSYITTIRDICIEKAWDDDLIIPKLLELGIDLEEPLVSGRTPANIIAGESIPDRLDDNDIYERVAGLFDYFDKESMELLNHEGKAAIHLAAEYDSYSVVEKMFQKGVDINLMTDAPSESGNTPLHIACYKQNVKTAKVLIEAGADDSLINTEEETPAHRLFANYRKYESKKCYEIMELLVHIDTPKSKTGETPLMLLMKKDPVYVKELTELLLKKGADVNRTDNKGNTPLLLYTEHRSDTDVVKLLIKAGADINARNKQGNSVLHYVLENGNCELARLLIKKGADYNVVNAKGESPVSIAVEKGYEVVLELMTDIKIPISVSDASLNVEEDERRIYRPEYEADFDDEDDWEEDYDEEEEADDWAENFEEEDTDDWAEDFGEEDEDADDWTENFDEEDADEKEHTEFDMTHEYQVILKTYSDMYGEEKGKQIADVVIRMSEMNRKGIAQENMEEYTQLAAQFQALMQS